MRYLLVFTLAIILISPLSARDVRGGMEAAQRGEHVTVFNMRFPRTAGQFHFREVIDNEKDHPGMGYTVAYESLTSDKATVFVYDKQLTSISDGPTKPDVIKELQQSAQDIYAVASRLGQTVQLADRYLLGRPKDKEKFHCAEFTLRSSVGDQHSYLCITGARKRFVKLRITLKEDTPTDTTAHDFVSVIAASLWNTDQTSKRKSAPGFQKGYRAYERGDYATALREWRTLALRGYASAQYNLGLMYHKGSGVPQDYAEAAKWYRKAAKQGNVRSQSQLGTMHLMGWGVPKDYVQARMWLEVAAQGSEKAAAFLEGMAVHLSLNMSPDQIAQAQHLAREWLEKHGK